MSARVASTRWLRLASGLVLICTLAGVAALGVDAANKMPGAQTLAERFYLFAFPLLALAAGIGLSAIVHALAHGPQAVPPPVALEPLVPAVALDQLVEAMAAAAKLNEPAPVVVPDPPQSTEPAPLHPAIEQYLEKSLRLLEEIREVSMLDDTERAARRQMSIRQRKLARLDEASSLIAKRQWADADAILHLLESLYPGDGEVLDRRNQLDDLRLIEANTDWQSTESDVLEVTAAGRHQQAIESLLAYIERNPTRGDGPALLSQVRADAQQFVEERAHTLFDQVKNEVDHRQWRQALGHVQQLLMELPDHQMSQRVRPQVPTIQKNAEIEERREQEARIHELVRATQYAEAIESSERLIRQFPGSPQARTLGAALPKLKRLAAEQDRDPQPASPFAD